MNRLLIVATLLGGISSLWFLYDKVISWLRKPDTSSRRWNGGNATAKAIVYYSAILGGAAMYGVTSLLVSTSSAWPGVAIIVGGALCGADFFSRRGGHPRKFSLLRWLGGLAFLASISTLIVVLLSPGGPAAIQLLSFGLLPDVPTGFYINSMLAALTGGLCGVMGGVTGCSEILDGESLAHGMSMFLVWYLSMMLSSFLVLFAKGQAWQIVALAVLGSIVAMGIYMTIDLLPE